MAAAKVIAACMVMAAQTYGVPPEILLGIMKAEGGRIGQEVRNTNGSYDLGPMQINTIWMPELARTWRVDEETARRWVRDDACTNIRVSAWILKGHYIETKDYEKAVAYYHSRTPKYGEPYRGRVFKMMEKHGYSIDEIVKRGKVTSPYSVASK
tara:strand:- start:30006 stop:30467 length:462 start_codon:yes stop_codon:yes gene_type:complete